VNETGIVLASEASQQVGRGIVRVEDLDGLWRFSEIVVKSKCCPENWGDQATAFIALQAGSEVGLSLAQTMQSVYVIGRRPALYGDAPLGLCMASGKFDFSQFCETWDDAKKLASCTACRIGGKPVTHTFSLADAERAGLPRRNPNYHTYPQRMCPRRARAWTLRDVFPDVLMGLAIREDVEDDIIDVKAMPVPSNEPSRASTMVEQLKAATPATAPVAETPTTPSGGTGESDFAQKKAALEQIGSVCVAISAGNYGLTAPTLDKYRPVAVENTIANLTACLAELRTLLPENHMLLKPPAEKPKRGRPAGSKNKPAAQQQPELPKNEPPATETVPDSEPVLVDSPALEDADAVDYLPQIDAILGDLQRRGTPRENMLPIIATNLTSLRNRGVDSKSIVTGSGISKSSPKECDGAEICVVLVALARHMTAEEQAKLVDDLVAVQGKMMTAVDPTDGF
jgi:hypothetical protein